MVSFISIAYVVVNWFFCIDSASMKWLLFGIFWALTLPNIVWSCWNFDFNFDFNFEAVSNKKNSAWKILQSLGFWFKWNVVSVHIGAQFTVGKPKILLKTKISAKSPSLGIINNVSARSQKNHRILVKLS